MKFGEDLMFAHYPFENTPRENLYTRCLKLTREDPSKILEGDLEGNRQIISD